MTAVLIIVEVSFGYPGQPVLFTRLDFGVNMESRGALHVLV